KLSSWTFDVKRRLIIQAELSRQQNGQDKVIYNVPESILEEGIVHPGSIQDFRELFQTMVKEEEDTQASSLEKEICFRSRGETGYRWERVIVTPIFDENHQHIRSVGTSLDITKEKTAVQQYKNELQMIDKANAANLITKSRYNLTKNNMEFIESGEKSQGKRLGDSTYDRSLERVIRVAVEPEKQEELRAVFNRETLIHKYHEGSRGFSLEYQRHRGEASVIWARTECRTFEEPYSGDIICFFYSYDISEKKFSEEMIKTVVDLDYDYLARINCLENTYTLYTQKQKCADILVPLPYDERIVQYARKFLPPEEVEANIRQMSIENLKAQLETAPSYSFFCKVVGRDGKVRRKKMQASYLNRASEQILMTRMDITDLYEREQKRLSELGAAMERVEEANRAKTEFLSRMSHDIRTPLNAVLGLSGLGKESGSLEEAHEYLEKIELSGGYLLSIINEVLSLSKIESKTMELHLKPISVPRFIQDVLAVVAPAAKEKGISLEVNKEKVHCLNLLLDKVYVQQVLVNLLSNAIKFTNPGGRVWLILEEVSQKAGYVQSRVVVKDTGIGISKAFFPKLFQPFEQEGGAEDLQRQGTGLGLSIVKSLVE
ncbi:MAG: HAMP domain-containing sensor histidine kinase, partial [Anaerovoracaceae bacterium]